jgi:hypothetical protein
MGGALSTKTAQKQQQQQAAPMGLESTLWST